MLPEGVAMMRPSPSATVTKLPSTYTSSRSDMGEEPLAAARARRGAAGVVRRGGARLGARTDPVGTAEGA